jgi:hypothetical protein
MKPRPAPAAAPSAGASAARVPTLAWAIEAVRLLAARPASCLAWWGLTSTAMLLIPSAFVTAHSLTGPRSPWPVLLTLFLVFLLAVVLSCAVYRAALRPSERAFAYLRFGVGELKVIAGALVSGALLTVVMVLFFLVLSPVFDLTRSSWRPGSDVEVLTACALAANTLGVRLSLAGPAAFERGLGLGRSWSLTRRRFWPLFGLWLMPLAVCGLLVILIKAAQAALGSPAVSLQAFPRGGELGPIAALAAYVAVLGLAAALQLSLMAAFAAAAYRSLDDRGEATLEAFD